MRKHLSLCYNHISWYTAIDPAHTTTDVFSKTAVEATLLASEPNDQNAMGMSMRLYTTFIMIIVDYIMLLAYRRYDTIHQLHIGAVLH